MIGRAKQAVFKEPVGYRGSPGGVADPQQGFCKTRKKSPGLSLLAERGSETLW